MSQNIWGEKTQFFYSLTPEVIDNSLKQLGIRPTGRVLALNSLENRVYDVEAINFECPEGPYSQDSIVVKFYRPGRWSEKAIKEEHQFCLELQEFEVPVIAPLEIDGKTLHIESESNLFYSVYPKIRGRLLDELNLEQTQQIGRLSARIHNIGGMGKFQYRPSFDIETYVHSHLETLMALENLPTAGKHYIEMIKLMEPSLKTNLSQYELQRIHGDMHRGNILWTSQGPFVTDFDDCMNGPIEQDLWLLFPGRDQYSLEDRENFLEAYKTMGKNTPNLPAHFIETMRAIRMIHFNGWIAKRWADPTFKKVYEDFMSDRYWESQLLDLKEQMGHCQQY